MQQVEEMTNFCPDADILDFLQDMGFDELGDLIAYSVGRTDCYFLAFSIPIPQRKADSLAIIDFLFMCELFGTDQKWLVECIKGSIIRIAESEKLEVRADCIQWASDGPFDTKMAWLEKLLAWEAGTYDGEKAEMPSSRTEPASLEDG